MTRAAEGRGYAGWVDIELFRAFGHKPGAGLESPRSGRRRLNDVAAPRLDGDSGGSAAFDMLSPAG